MVNAGDVIGYVGRTGYSTTENVNNINTSHLHFGLELVFDESQKESDNEIWIDLYAITKLLQKASKRNPAGAGNQRVLFHLFRPGVGQRYHRFARSSAAFS